MSLPVYFTAAGQPNWNVETRTAGWDREFAFGSLEPTALIYRAPFTQIDNAYVRPDDANLANYNLLGRTCYFTNDTGFADQGANVARWTRELRTLPANYNTAATYSYEFPGYFLGRSPFTDEPTSRVQLDFFLIGNVSHGASYATPFDVPRFPKQNFAWAYSVASGFTDAGTVTIFDGYLANTNANILLFASNPNLSTYQGWVAGGTELEAASSTIEQWAGPIWMRTRRFVKAQ